MTTRRTFLQILGAAIVMSAVPVAPDIAMVQEARYSATEWVTIIAHQQEYNEYAALLTKIVNSEMDKNSEQILKKIHEDALENILYGKSIFPLT